MRVIVIGGGPAGMMAAIAASYNGNEVSIYEKNEKLGKKLFITGKGRCNVTNAGTIDDIKSHIVTNPKFMYSSLSEYTNLDVYDFFENRDCKLKVERGNRVFPVSDKSSDIIKTLKKEIEKLNIKVFLNTKVVDIKDKDGKFDYIVLDNKDKVFADKCIVATGGKSYPVTGSDGDGYKWAKECGHKINKPIPALVPFVLKEEDAKKMQGLSLKNVNIKFTEDEKVLYEEMGEMLFTHFGISGPVVLSASSYVNKQIKDNIKVHIDLKPALTFEMLDKRLLKDFDLNINKNLNNSLGKLLPLKLIPVVIKRAGIDPYKKVNVITKEERTNLCNVIKNLEYSVVNLRGFDEAIITCGGVDVKEINPKTLESKIIKDLYFIGEVLDVDATTGGYNLQIAWSTGYACGNNIKEW